MDGAHSIVGTWEGEMVRDNFAISLKRNRGEDRGVIISTHKTLESYQRTKTHKMLLLGSMLSLHLRQREPRKTQR